MQSLTPKQIVSELDRFIIGQHNAKKAVAIALRNRWRRLQIDSSMRDEVLPKNILMIGPTGVGKTEIARRLAKLIQAPFVKVEATKFTEVGYVGRDVEQIIRDLMEVALIQVKEDYRQKVTTAAQKAVHNRLIIALVGDKSSDDTKEAFSIKLENKQLEDREIEIEVKELPSNGMSTFDVPGMPGAQMGMVNIGDMLGKALGQNKKVRKLTIAQARKLLIEEESDKLIDQETIVQQAIKDVEQNGIVFIDEIDKICARQESRSGDVSREGVQRDLLPLIEGTAVNTKHGVVKTDHILFITSGAFHLSKPSDLLPELQGRLPIRVEMNSLTKDDFSRILTEPESSLIKQYQALIATEGVTLTFDSASITEVAALAAEINENVENIGARRLHTVLERLLEEISFTASERQGEEITITADLVKSTVGELAKRIDISKFVL